MKVLIILIVMLASLNQAQSQVLNVTQVIQEQSEWCWAAVSACIFDYYGMPLQQCTIAEFTRNVATWHNFGETNCCENASKGCNYWNYNYGYIGSIQDILQNFANISNDGIRKILSQTEITSDIANNRLFVIRWAWNSGGGHFIVGHGLVGGNLYYMDPWYGEGLKVANYSWVCTGGNHTWTHTNRLSTSPPMRVEFIENQQIFSFKNDIATKELIITCNGTNEKVFFDIINVLGQAVSSGSFIDKTIIQTSTFSPGLYLIKIYQHNLFIFDKFIIE